METIAVQAWAKINLALDVLGQRPDSYHDLRMVMQTLALHDTLLIQKTNQYPLRLLSSDEDLPTDERNLVYRAARYLIDEYAIPTGIQINLQKRIPVSAGLGGGSSDCAATLLGINRLFALDIPMPTLFKIGLQFGADVPFCLLGGTALAEGIGERLTPLPPHPAVCVLLARPPVPVSSRTVFQRFDPAAVTHRPDIDGMIRALHDGDAAQIAGHFCNVLASVTASLHFDINRIIDLMRATGAYNAAMTGSGPTVFGYFPTPQTAQSAMQVIQASLPHVQDIFVTEIHHTTKPVEKGCSI